VRWSAAVFIVALPALALLVLFALYVALTLGAS
jgi:hypothetical protein